MAESRLLVITSGLGKSGFSPELTKDLTAAGLGDVSDTAQTLAPGYVKRTSVASSGNNGHISGEQLVDLFADGFSSGADFVCVVGTNAPQIPVSYILEAFGRLTPHQGSLVAGPTHRGNFYLLGAYRTFPRSLLKDIFTGASNVSTEREKRSIAGELSLSLLPSLLSLETPSDGQRLLRDMRRGVATAPWTQDTLRKTGLE